MNNSENNNNIKLTKYYIISKPTYFLKISRLFLPWSILLTNILIIAAIYLAFIIAPSDFQQGENYRIIYIHVPVAWMSLFIYSCITLSSIVYLVKKHPLAALIAKANTKLGIIFTSLTLITGSLWGLPMWGTYWVWDARLTSVLVLLFIYLGHYIIFNVYTDKIRAANVASILAIVGFINIPIIKFSVDWWNTLHQASSITQFNTTIHISMLLPILLITLAFMSYSIIIFIYELRKEILINRKESFITTN